MIYYIKDYTYAHLHTNAIWYRYYIKDYIYGHLHANQIYWLAYVCSTRVRNYRCCLTAVTGQLLVPIDTYNVAEGTSK